MDQTEAIDKVRRFKLLLSRHFELDAVYLFGSYSKGTNREDSDIDVAVVVEEITGDFFATNPLLWKIRRQVDDRIEPILIEKKHDQSGFLDEIRRTGIEILT